MADFLAPQSPPPAYDLLLAQQIQATVAGITGLPGSLVRPRWQPDPPAQPPKSVNWCAVGFTSIDSDMWTNSVHDGTANQGDGATTEYRGEEIDVLASFYGPAASGYASLLRDGFAVQQNLSAMLTLGFVIARLGAMRNVSGPVNAENLTRYDFEFWLRRRVARVYAIPNIQSASGEILSEQGSVQGPAIGVNPFFTG